MEVTERDLLLISKLVYFDLNENEQRKGNVKVQELAARVMKNMEKIGKGFGEDYELLEQIVNIKKYPDSVKYKNWTINDYTNQENSNGLAAMAISTGDKKGVVVYRGTEGMFQVGTNQVDMNDNLELIRKTDTKQQEAALEFLKQQESKFDSIIITGHSKGGNDGLYAGLKAPEKLAAKILAIKTFNAPGFNEDFVKRIQDNKDFDLFRGKITEYQTSNDIVSSILINIGNVVICKSNTKDSSVSDSHLLPAFEFDGDSVIEISYEAGSGKSTASMLTKSLTMILQKVPEPYLSRMVDAVIYTNTAALDKRGIHSRTKDTFNSIRSALEEYHKNHKNFELILNNLITIPGLLISFKLATSPEVWEKIGSIVSVAVVAVIVINLLTILGDIAGEMAIEALNNFIDTLADMAVDALNKFINTVKEKVTEFVNWIYDKAVETGKYIKSKLIEAKEAVTNAIVRFCDETRAIIKKAYENFVYASKVLYASVKAAIKTMKSVKDAKIYAMLNDIETLAYKANRLREVYNSNMSVLNETINLVGGVQSKYHESYVRSACYSVLSEAQAAKRLLVSIEKELYKKKNMMIEAVKLMREADYNMMRYILSNAPMFI